MNKNTKKSINKYLQENPGNKKKLEELMRKTSTPVSKADGSTVLRTIADIAVKIAVLIGGTNAGFQIIDRFNLNTTRAEDPPTISMNEEEFSKFKSLLESEQYKEYSDLYEADAFIAKMLDSLLLYEQDEKTKDFDFSRLIEEFGNELGSLKDFSTESLEISDPKYLDQCTPSTPVRVIESTEQFTALFYVVGYFLTNDMRSDLKYKSPQKPNKTK